MRTGRLRRWLAWAAVVGAVGAGILGTTAVASADTTGDGGSGVGAVVGEIVADQVTSEENSSVVAPAGQEWE